MSLLENFVTEGSEKADEPAKKRCNVGWRRDGADEGQHSAAKKEGGSRGIAVCSQLSLSGGGMERRRTPKRSESLWTKKTGSEEASHRVVCSSEQISVHEVCAEQ